MKLKSFGENIKDIILTEHTDFNIEKDKSSEIELFPEGGKILKKKERTRKKTIYEAYMMDLWSDIFKIYNKEQELKFQAPRSRALGLGSELETYLLMDFCRGTPIKKLRGISKKPTRFLGKDETISTIAMYHLGALQKIKENEGLFHSDYDQRHVLFYMDKTSYNKPRLSVIDVENSRLVNDSHSVLSENEGFHELISTIFQGDNTQEAYLNGHNSIPNMKVSTNDLINKTEEKFNNKFKREHLPYVHINPFNQTIEYEH